jgi:hypothetical protein
VCAARRVGIKSHGVLAPAYGPTLGPADALAVVRLVSGPILTLGQQETPLPVEDIAIGQRRPLVRLSDRPSDSTGSRSGRWPTK